MHKQFFYFLWPQCAGAHFPTRPPSVELSFNAVPVLGSDHLIFMGRAGRCFRAWIYFHSRCDPVFLFVYNTIHIICTIEFTLFGQNSILDFFSPKHQPPSPSTSTAPIKSNGRFLSFGQFLHVWCCWVVLGQITNQKKKKKRRQWIHWSLNNNSFTNFVLPLHLCDLLILDLYMHAIKISHCNTSQPFMSIF